MEIPAPLSQRVVATYGRAGAEWLRTLPLRVGEYAQRWSLTLEARPLLGASLSYLLPATLAEGTPVVLKLSPPHPWVAHEAAALGHWRGAGAVRLETADPGGGALLLERAIPGTALATLCGNHDEAATTAAAAVIRELQQQRSFAAPDAELPHLSDWIAKLDGTASQEVAPALRAACQEARAVATELLQERAEPVILHGDLHQWNLVAAGRVHWLAIDPKGLWGPPEAEPAALLRNPRSWLLGRRDRDAVVERRIRQLTEELGFDCARLQGWGYVLAVLAAWWALEDGETADVPRWLACAASIRAARP